MKDSISLRFLYRTVIGRAILKLLINPAVSKPAGFLLSTRFSKLFIPHFIKKNNIDLTDIEIPFGGFVSFNDFFTRIRKSPVLKPAASQLISPCEGFLTPLEIRNDIILDIKNTSYSLSDLLKDDKLAEAFENGTALIFNTCKLSPLLLFCRREYTPPRKNFRKTSLCTPRSAPYSACICAEQP